MFKYYTLNLEGRERNIKWSEKDVYCLPAIDRDWHTYSHMFLKYLTKTRVVIQAGGSGGLYPLYYSTIFDRVFTFEPDSVNFNCLVNNCTNNKIVKFNTALSDECGFVNIGNPDPENVGMHTVGGGEIIVYAITIDSLKIPYVDLIHLDVEGYEANVLRGAIETIKANRPIVIAECLRDEELIDEQMKSLDYTCVLEYGIPLNKVYLPNKGE